MVGVPHCQCESICSLMVEELGNDLKAILHRSKHLLMQKCKGEGGGGKRIGLRHLRGEGFAEEKVLRNRENEFVSA